ncbi:redox-regulated ATPase YchF [Rickettsiales endosymbiont of Peranema trichophorum]|uniref:redox-regulated ATPase YchF n=1 Tax=Rickettsiales endosymbiont of Peranema trichophorum TaxID=2486577 RepID=UPI001022D844|nr:redox-regulated ATPase YchF [Rickettsiales endosymbiont of Peranema trichophorum]RZI45172.1 redox-regulated ATPase YchF [Rickettsiales endosymbiont of Peranema trichophorum]
MLQCGIVGLPNVGKSTFFNALTLSKNADAANYPFCTIEPNVGKVIVPDSRLHRLAEVVRSASVIPTQIEFVDIAGLVKGASKGEGLGHQFLSHIREVDAIVQVVRCFEDDNIVHVEGGVDPIRDIEIIEIELIQADYESLSKRIPVLEKKAKNNKELEKELQLVHQALSLLLECKPVRHMVNKENEKLIRNLQLLTSKPVMYVCNVGENDAVSGNSYSNSVIQRARSENLQCVTISVQIESDIANLETELERQAFLNALNISEDGLSKVIRSAYDVLNLITFFTVGPKETRAWTITKGTFAPQAAGAIHSDFERGFIRAETISYSDYIDCNGEVGARAAGKLRPEGKEYVVNDGDVITFRFNC